MVITRTALALLAALLSPPTLAAQTPAVLDSARLEVVRSRAFQRAAETQATKALAVLDSALARQKRAPFTIYMPADSGWAWIETHQNGVVRRDSLWVRPR